MRKRSDKYQSINNTPPMNEHELYDNLSKEEVDKLTKEAEQRWGNTPEYRESAEKMNKMSKAEWAKIKEEGDAILKEGTGLMGNDVKSKEVQDFVDRHYRHLANFYTPNLELYRGLAEMYVADERFTAYFEKYSPGFAQFMHDAMIAFCDMQKD